MDMVGDEEVEEWDEEAIASATPEIGVTDIAWDPEDLYLESNDESSGTHQTPVAALTPVSMPTKETLCPALPSLKEPQRKIPAPEPVVIDDLVSDCSDISVVGFSRPELHQIVPWAHFKAQNMCEPLWQTELAQIQKDEEIHYITAMLTWFCHWWIRKRSWPQLSQSKFNLSQEMKEAVDLHFALALGYNVMFTGEMQTLKALSMLQCLTEAGPRRPALGYVCQCVEFIMNPMMAIGIAFVAPAILVSVTLTCSSQSTSLETDISIADMLSLLLSVGSAGDLAREVNIEAWRF